MAIREPKFYLIRCSQMRHADRIEVRDLLDLLQMIERYVARFGFLEFIHED